MPLGAGRVALMAAAAGGAVEPGDEWEQLAYNIVSSSSVASVGFTSAGSSESWEKYDHLCVFSQCHTTYGVGNVTLEFQVNGLDDEQYNSSNMLVQTGYSDGGANTQKTAEDFGCAGEMSGHSGANTGSRGVNHTFFYHINSEFYKNYMTEESQSPGYSVGSSRLQKHGQIFGTISTTDPIESISLSAYRNPSAQIKEWSEFYLYGIGAPE